MYKIIVEIVFPGEEHTSLFSNIKRSALKTQYKYYYTNWEDHV